MTRIKAQLLLVAGLLLGIVAVAGPEARAEVRSAAMAIDANTGAVLHEQFADAPRHPASLTKIMTIFLAFREVEKGRLTFATPIRISERAASVAPSKLDLDPGEEIIVGDAIKALVTKSANDIAVALAEHIGGSETGFARMMNETAAEIGMRSTRFYNASGLPDNRQITTARDMLTLALRLQDEFPQHYRYFNVKSFDYRGKTYRTHNTLMHGFPGMDGIKTGYTKASGFNVVSSVHTENKHVVAVVFGGVTAAARNSHMRMILYRALEKASKQRTRKPNAILFARRSTAPERVQTGLSAMPGDQESNVVAGNTIEPEAEQLKANWKTETKSAPKIAAMVPKLKETPQPVRAPKAKRPDQIAAVIAQGDTVPTTRVVTTTTIKFPPTEPQAPAVPPVEAAMVPPRLDLHALREAMAPGAEPGQPSQPQTPMPSDIERLTTRSDEPSPPSQIQTGSGGPVAFATPLNSGRAQNARPPSTLGAQAEAIESNAGVKRPPIRDAVFARANAAPAPSHLIGPAATPRVSPVVAGKGFEIQIGAYSSAEEAQARIAAARKKATGLLDTHEHVAVAVQRGDRQIYRARFVNFSEDAASNACLELRRMAIDCFVMKSEPR